MRDVCAVLFMRPRPGGTTMQFPVRFDVRRNQPCRSGCPEILPRELLMLFPLPAKTFDERGNIFCSPDRGSGTKLHGFGITPGPTAFPPGALAYGNHAENLRKTQKAVSGNGRLNAVS